MSLQDRSLNLIHAFIQKDLNRELKEWPVLHQTSSARSFGRDFATLRLWLPRRTGSTKICCSLCHELSCLVIQPNHNACGMFHDMYQNDYGKRPCMTTIELIKQSQGILGILDVSVREALERSKVIIFDVFRAYSENKAVDMLYDAFGKTHKFIMLY